MVPAVAAARLQQSLGLSWPPVAISFRAEAPPGVAPIATSLAAGCGYWKQAAEGQTFYTTPDDHYGCPVGAHTHGVPLPAERAGEFQSIVGTMLSLEYLREEELPAIPRRNEPFGVAVYAPLHAAPVDPDLVLVRGTPRQVMLLSEAARAAGVFDDGATMGRPACAMLPHAENTGRGVTSLGCIGNRVYTGLGDNELYLTLPGRALAAVVEKLDTLVTANRALEGFHQGRLAERATTAPPS